MDLRFQGHYDRQTMRQALLLANKPTTKGMIFRVGLLTLMAGGVIVAFVDFLRAGRALSGVRTVRLVIGFAVLAYFYLRPYLTIRRIANRFKEKSDNPPTFHGLIDRRGLTLNPGPSERLVEWEKISDWKVTEDLAVLIKDDGNIYPFLPSFFDNVDEWARFNNLFKERIQIAK
jgi:hypothetical protein